MMQASEEMFPGENNHFQIWVDASKKSQNVQHYDILTDVTPYVLMYETDQQSGS